MSSRSRSGYSLRTFSTDDPYAICDTITETATLRVNVVLRSRLRAWADHAARGATLADAARAARMPRIAVEMLSAAQNATQAADVLDFLARYHASRFSRARMFLQSAGVPLMTIAFAIVVAFVAISLLAPLVSLIQNLSASTTKWRL